MIRAPTTSTSATARVLPGRISPSSRGPIRDTRVDRFGAGQTQTTAYGIASDSVDYWRDRLESQGVEFTAEERFDETVLRFSDPDGIELELVATDDVFDATPWEDGPVPTEHQLRGFYNVALAVDDYGPTETILTDVLGYELEAEAGGRRRYRSATGGPGSVVDLVETDAGRGQMGVGTVHHVAFMAESVEEQEEWREAFAAAGLSPSEVIDRKYFQSIYTREPGGVLFERWRRPGPLHGRRALEELGERQRPGWLENEREEIEAQLPEFEGPNVDSSGD